MKSRLKKWLPKPEELRKNKILKLFAPFLADPRLWHMNRNTLVRAVYIGVMCAFFPLPGQMPLALIGALLFRANIPMAIGLTWLTNPITTLPVFWVAYYVGAILLDEPIISIRTIGKVITDITAWAMGDGGNPFVHQLFSLKAFVLGLIICAVLSSLILGLAFSWLWRYRTIRNWKKRTKRIK